MSNLVSNIMVVVFGVIALAAAVFGWWYENGPQKNDGEEKDSNATKKK
ncbi:MAG: hypothetical protein IJ873_01785 [Lachnospiraceae bacterium]|nr:hypothetical protein [Lachnospiraceae bacterium]